MAGNKYLRFRDSPYSLEEKPEGRSITIHKSILALDKTSLRVLEYIIDYTDTNLVDLKVKDVALKMATNETNIRRGINNLLEAAILRKSYKKNTYWLNFNVIKRVTQW